MHVGDRIREGRGAKGLSQNDLARTLNTTPMSISRWERGIASPSIRFCEAMAEAFGVSLDWLISGKGEAPSAESLKATGTDGA